MYRNNKELFFMDIKTSLTPVLFASRIRALSEIYKKPLIREQIGLVEREAWDNYTIRYPSNRTCIVMACPYNPKLLLAEWANSIKLIFRFKEDKNENAAGSQTPHVNLDLNTMRDLATFIKEEFGCQVADEYYNEMIKYVKTWPVSNPGRPWKQYNSCVRELQENCPWLRQRNKDGWLEDKPGPNLWST
jgi:hypothetical protein